TGEAAWKWLANEIQEFARLGEAKMVGIESTEPAVGSALLLAHRWLKVTPSPKNSSSQQKGEFCLRVTRDLIQGLIFLEWSEPSIQRAVAKGKISCTGKSELTWELEIDGQRQTLYSNHELSSIRSMLTGWLTRLPARRDTFQSFS